MSRRGREGLRRCPVRDPLAKGLHRRGNICEANETRIGREDRRGREEVWWPAQSFLGRDPPEKGLHRRGNFHATYEERRGRERRGGRKKREIPRRPPSPAETWSRSSYESRVGRNGNRNLFPIFPGDNFWQGDRRRPSPLPAEARQAPTI